MQKILDLISEEIKKAFEAAGYDQELGRVTLSNRPDLCEFQCNGAMAGAKKYHKAPLMIAQDVAEKLQESDVLSEVSAVAPGFFKYEGEGILCAGLSAGYVRRGKIRFPDAGVKKDHH